MGTLWPRVNRWLTWFHRWSGVVLCLLFIAWFASGAVLGFFANRLYSATTVIASKTAAAAKNPPTPEEFRKWLTGYYQKHLELTDDQVQKMNLILDESQAQVKAIHAQMDPQLDAVHANQITRMNLMLTPAQQTE